MCRWSSGLVAGGAGPLCRWCSGLGAGGSEPVCRWCSDREMEPRARVELGPGSDCGAVAQAWLQLMRIFLQGGGQGPQRGAPQARVVVGSVRPHRDFCNFAAEIQNMQQPCSASGRDRPRLRTTSRLRLKHPNQHVQKQKKHLDQHSSTITTTTYYYYCYYYFYYYPYCNYYYYYYYYYY